MSYGVFAIPVPQLEDVTKGNDGNQLPAHDLAEASKISAVCAPEPPGVGPSFQYEKKGLAWENSGAPGRRPMRQQIATILLLWLALQIPLGSFIGDCIRFGTARPAPYRARARN